MLNAVPHSKKAFRNISESFLWKVERNLEIFQKYFYNISEIFICPLKFSVEIFLKQFQKYLSNLSKIFLKQIEGKVSEIFQKQMR